MADIDRYRQDLVQAATQLDKAIESRDLRIIVNAARHVWDSADAVSASKEYYSGFRADALKSLCEAASVVELDPLTGSVEELSSYEVHNFSTTIMARIDDLTNPAIFSDLEDVDSSRPEKGKEETKEEQDAQRRIFDKAEEWEKRISGETKGGQS